MELTAWILTFAGCLLGTFSIYIAAQVLRKQNDIQRMLMEIEEKKIESEERKFMKSRIDAKAHMRLEAVLELLTALDKYQNALGPLKTCLKMEAPDYVDVYAKYSTFTKQVGVDLPKHEETVFNITSKLELLFNFNDREIESIMKRVLAIITNSQQQRRVIRENNCEKFPSILENLYKSDVEISQLIAQIPSRFAKYVNDDICDLPKTVSSK